MGYAALPLIADYYGVTCRALEIACRNILLGRTTTYHGYPLVIRQMRSSKGGGRSGLRYEVKIDSLPPDLQQRLKDRSSPATLPLFAEPTPQRAAERDWWLRMLGPLLALSNGGERAAAIAALAAQDNLTDWRGKPVKLAERSIYRRLKAYRDEGALAFAPRARADKGHAKVLISLAAEQTIPFDDLTWENIASALRNYIRAHWKKGATLKLIRAHANRKFRELIEAAGFDHCHTLPDSTLIVPRHFIEAERVFRHVHTLFHDASSTKTTASEPSARAPACCRWIGSSATFTHSISSACATMARRCTRVF